MTDEDMINAAEANIRADYREGRIDKQRFQKEMLIVARSRAQLLTPSTLRHNGER